MKTVYTTIILSFLMLTSAGYLHAESPPAPDNGPYKLFDDNGQLRFETVYKNKQRHGITKTYYKNGQLESKYIFKHGKRDGTAKNYHKNGKLKMLSNYKNDTLNGTQKIFNEEGKLRVKKKIVKGKTVHFQEFSASGIPISSAKQALPPSKKKSIK